MGFHVVYVADGELTKVKRVNYVDRIRNFAYLNQPYNKMKMINIPAIEGIYEIEYESLDVDTELLSIVVTCSGYGENDYYNLWVNGELWFDTWFPTEVKEGLYIGTATYVYPCAPKTPFLLRFVNMSGTAKKLWLGLRFLREKTPSETREVPILNTFAVQEPSSVITSDEASVIPETISSPITV